MRSAQVFLAIALWPFAGVGCTPSSSSSADAASAEDGGEETGAVPDAGFRCGLTVCPTNQVCCVDPTTAAARCLAESLCRGVAITCDTMLSCPPGQVCCASFPFQQNVVIGCSAQCAGPGNFQICVSDSECPSGQVCSRGAFVRACVVPFDAGLPFPSFDAGSD